MPRLNTDLTRNLKIMKASRRKLDGPRLVQGTEIAELLGLTWRILQARIKRDPQFPIVERGANGKAWTFEAVAVLDYMIADTQRLGAQRKARAEKTSRLAGFRSGDADTDGTGFDVDASVDSSADTAAQARALNALSQSQMTAHRLKQMQGEYVRADDHSRVIATIMSTMQVEILSVASKLDPAGLWTPDLRKSVEDAMKNALLATKAACDRELRALRAASH